jgi:hypothetical protein
MSRTLEAAGALGVETATAAMLGPEAGLAAGIAEVGLIGADEIKTALGKRHDRPEADSVEMGGATKVDRLGGAGSKRYPSNNLAATNNKVQRLQTHPDVVAGVKRPRGVAAEIFRNSLRRRLNPRVARPRYMRSYRPRSRRAYAARIRRGRYRTRRRRYPSRYRRRFY